MANIYDGCEVIFVDNVNDRVVKQLKSESANVLYIAELPLNRQVIDEEYIQIMFNNEHAERNKTEISELLHSVDTKLPFKLKDKDNEILLNTKEELNAVLLSLIRFLESGIVMSSLSIRSWENGKLKTENFSVSGDDGEKVKDILSEFGQPTKIETKSIEKDIVILVISSVSGNLIWYVTKSALDKILNKIKNYLSYKKKLDYIQ